MFKKMFQSKASIYEILLVVFVASILIANTVVNRVIMLPFGWTSTGAVIAFIIPMLIGDIIAEVYGKDKMFKAIILGFALNLLMVATYTAVNLFPSVQGQETIDEAYRIALGSSARILVASMLAYLFGMFVNTKVMLWMKGKNNNHFTVRAFISTVFGQFTDNAIFFILAFSFVLPFDLILLILVVETGIEILVESLILPFTHKLQKRLKELKD